MVEYHLDGDFLVLGIENLSDQTLHISMKCLDTSNWSVKGVFPAQIEGKPSVSEPLSPKHLWQIPARHTQGKTDKSYEEIIKVFAATIPMQLSMLHLPPIDEDGRESGSYGNIADPGRLFQTVSPVSRTVQFGSDDLVIKVMPAGGRGVDWDSIIC